MQHLHFSLPVSVSFDPTAYTVTEGVDATAELMLVRSGDLNREVVVSVSSRPGTAIGMTQWGIYALRHVHVYTPSDLVQYLHAFT